MKAEKIIYCLLKIHLDFIHDDVKVFPFYEHFHYIDCTKVEKYCFNF